MRKQKGILKMKKVNDLINNNEQDSPLMPVVVVTIL